MSSALLAFAVPESPCLRPFFGAGSRVNLDVPYQD